MGTVELLVESRHRAAHRTDHDAVGGFDDRNVGAELLRYGSDLKADIASAHHDEPRTGSEQWPDGVDVGDPPQVMNTGKRVAYDGQPAHACAGGEDQFVIWEHAPVGEPDIFGL